MNETSHWERVFREKQPTEVSWYRPHLELSIELIEAACPDRNAPVLDVGGGASTLVDDLLTGGYRSLTVVDISMSALEIARRRLGREAERVCWIVGDITEVELQQRHYAVWHDRAVLHFLIEADKKAAYVAAASRAIRPGGCMVLATFGPNGPERCSGLPVERYSAQQLAEQFAEFELVESQEQYHQTPSGVRQEFTYAVLRKPH